MIIEERDPGLPHPRVRGFSGFQGTQMVDGAPPPVALPAQPCDCQVACSYSYALTAKTVGTR